MSLVTDAAALLRRHAESSPDIMSPSTEQKQGDVVTPSKEGDVVTPSKEDVVAAALADLRQRGSWVVCNPFPEERWLVAGNHRWLVPAHASFLLVRFVPEAG